LSVRLGGYEGEPETPRRAIRLKAGLIFQSLMNLSSFFQRNTAPIRQLLLIYADLGHIVLRGRFRVFHIREREGGEEKRGVLGGILR
jgi:hypothetical protein